MDELNSIHYFFLL